MAIHVLVIYGNKVCTQLVKSVIDKLKYQLVLPPVMLMFTMSMERRYWMQIGLNKWCSHLECLSETTLPSVVVSWRDCEE